MCNKCFHSPLSSSSLCLPPLFAAFCCLAGIFPTPRAQRDTQQHWEHYGIKFSINGTAKKNRESADCCRTLFRKLSYCVELNHIFIISNVSSLARLPCVHKEEKQNNIFVVDTSMQCLPNFEKYKRTSFSRRARHPTVLFALPLKCLSPAANSTLVPLRSLVVDDLMKWKIKLRDKTKKEQELFSHLLPQGSTS